MCYLKFITLWSGQILAPLTQEAWTLFEQENITPSFRWVRRNTDELKRVDELSKKVVFALTPEVITKFKDGLKCDVLSVNHNEIANTLAMIIVRKLNCALLVPRWEGKSWWSILKENVTGLYPVLSSSIKFSEDIQPGWEFLLAVFVFR
jgi:hypothetical protein